MQPMIRKAEYGTQASLITDSILTGQDFVCVIGTYGSCRKQLRLLTSSLLSISKKNENCIYLLTSYECCED